LEHFSILDLSPIPEGFEAADAIANTVVLICRVAAATQTMRIGSGGIMLPNHAPLVVAEQFGTLATMFPGRIDLGLGRAPGTDANTMRALRRYMAQADNFPQDVVELMSYMDDQPEDAPVRAIPGAGTKVPVWILGSSLYGAQLAAVLGLPYAFASHFAPQALDEALTVYRHMFQPSEYLDRPRVMVAASVCAADTDAEAARLRTSSVLSFARRLTGQRGKLPAPDPEAAAQIPPHVMARVTEDLSVSAWGGPAKLRADFQAILDRHQPDELILTGWIHDHAARVRNFEIAAGVLSDLRA
jgi:luciferase family oxidoreductase group 1